MSTSNALVKIIEQSGLDKSKSDYLLEKFADYTSIAAEWEKKAKEIVVTDESQKDLMQQASEGRKLLKAKRVEIEKTRKELKEQSLNEGRAIDGIAKALTALIEPTEKYLDEQEKFAERKEAERIKTLQQERYVLLKPYLSEYDLQIPMDLGKAPESQFNALLAGYKATYEKRIADEKKAEEDRIAKEEQDKKDREAQRIENERLKAEAQQKTKIRNVRNAELRPYIVFIRDYNRMLDLPEEEYLKELSEVQEAANQQWEFDRQEKIRKDSEKQAQDKILKDQKAENERLGKELLQKQVLEQRAKEEQEKLDAAPDKEKIKDLIKRLQEFELPEVKSKKAKAAIDIVQKEIHGLINMLSGTKI